MRYLLDTNILLRWVEPSDPDQLLVESALDRLVRSKASLSYTSQNVGEFWNACTRPANRNGFGLTPDETNRRARFFESQLQLLPDSLATHLEWRNLLVTHRVSGVQVHDARLAAAMRVHGVKRILTFNKADFARFTDIEALAPSDALALP